MLSWIIALAPIALAAAAMWWIKAGGWGQAAVARRFILCGLLLAAAILAFGIVQRPSLTALRQADAAIRSLPAGELGAIACRDIVAAAPMIERTSAGRIKMAEGGEIRIAESDWRLIPASQQDALADISARIRACDRRGPGARIVDLNSGAVLRQGANAAAPR